MICDPWFTLESVRVCIDTVPDPQKDDSATGAPTVAAGRIVSTARVYHRRARVRSTTWDDAGAARRGHTSLPVGALGDVGTHPGYRRRGLAGIVLADAFAYMDSAGCGISVLHSSLAAVAK